MAAAFLHVVGLRLAIGPVSISSYYFELAAVFALVSMTFRAKHDWVCIMGVILAVGVGVMTVLVGVVLLMFGAIPSLATQRVEAPDGRPYAVVVRESRDLIDPIYDLSIDTAGPIGLSWDVGGSTVIIKDSST